METFFTVCGVFYAVAQFFKLIDFIEGERK